MGEVKEKYTLNYFLGSNELGHKMNYGADGREEFFKGDVYPKMKRLLSISKIDKESIVLDVGCGRGDALRWCLQKESKRVTGIDFSSAAILISRITLGNWLTEENRVNLVCTEIEDYLPNDKFNRVLLFDVLEHVPQDELEIFFLRLVDSVLPGCLFIWWTPNFWDKDKLYKSDKHPKTSGMHCNKFTWERVTSFLSGFNLKPTDNKFVWRK